MIIKCIICFLIGGVAGYLIRAQVKMTSKEFVYQLGRLDAKETAEVTKAHERAWGISATPPKAVIIEPDRKEK